MANQNAMWLERATAARFPGGCSDMLLLSDRHMVQDEEGYCIVDNQHIYNVCLIIKRQESVLVPLKLVAAVHL